MGVNAFRIVLVALGAAFALAFAAICGPAFLQNPDVVAAFGAGFVNPFSTGYALDTIFCWLVLAAWVVFDAKVNGVRHGWVALAVGVVPGVATGLAVYLLLRLRQGHGARGASTLRQAALETTKPDAPQGRVGLSSAHGGALQAVGVPVAEGASVFVSGAGVTGPVAVAASAVCASGASMVVASAASSFARASSEALSSAMCFSRIC